jgi:hypothetical protein
MTTETMTEEIEVPITDESMELTDREIAILNDEDPDLIGTEVEEAVEPVAEEVETESEVAEEAEPVAIHSEEAITKAKSLGLSDEDLVDFASERSLQRHIALLERLEGLSATKADPEPVVDSGVVVDAEGLLDVSVYEAEDWDEKSLAIPKALRQEQELRKQLQAEVQRLVEIESRREQEATVSKFHEAVDVLNDTELFGRSRDEGGRSAKLTDAQIKNRNKLFQEVDTLAAVYAKDAEKAGKKLDLTWEEVVEKARVVVFGASKAAKPSKAEALKNQSATRRPVSKTAAASRSRVADDDSPESLANSPEIVAMWERFQRDNGVV